MFDLSGYPFILCAQLPYVDTNIRNISSVSEESDTIDEESSAEKEEAMTHVLQDTIDASGDSDMSIDIPNSSPEFSENDSLSDSVDVSLAESKQPDVTSSPVSGMYHSGRGILQTTMVLPSETYGESVLRHLDSFMENVDNKFNVNNRSNNRSIIGAHNDSSATYIDDMKYYVQALEELQKLYNDGKCSVREYIQAVKDAACKGDLYLLKALYAVNDEAQIKKIVYSDPVEMLQRYGKGARFMLRFYVESSLAWCRNCNALLESVRMDREEKHIQSAAAAREQMAEEDRKQIANESK